MRTERSHGFRSVGLCKRDYEDSYQQAVLELLQKNGAKVCEQSIKNRARWRRTDEQRQQAKKCNGVVDLEAIADRHPSIEYELTFQELKQKLHESIKRLRDYRHRQVVRGLLDGKTVDDLAKKMKCSDRTIRTLRGKAFRELRSHTDLKLAYLDHNS